MEANQEAQSAQNADMRKGMARVWASLNLDAAPPCHECGHNDAIRRIRFHTRDGQTRRWAICDECQYPLEQEIEKAGGNVIEVTPL